MEEMRDDKQMYAYEDCGSSRPVLRFADAGRVIGEHSERNGRAPGSARCWGAMFCSGSAGHSSGSRWVTGCYIIAAKIALCRCSWPQAGDGRSGLRVVGVLLRSDFKVTQGLVLVSRVFISDGQIEMEAD